MTLNELRRWLQTQSGLGDDDTRVVDAEGNDLHPTTGLLDGEHVMDLDGSGTPTTPSGRDGEPHAAH